MLKGAWAIIVAALTPKSILFRHDQIRDKDQEVKEKKRKEKKSEGVGLGERCRSKTEKGRVRE